MNLVNKQHIIYFAGIIDGEGSLGIEKSNAKYKSYTTRLCVINTSKDLMEWLIKNIGGKYDIRKKIPNRKICYRWYICGANLQHIIKEVIPYLIIKRPQAELILKFRENIGKTNWNIPDSVRSEREDLYLKSRELNKLG